MNIDNMGTVEILNYNKFELVKSDNSNIVIIKLNNINGNLKELTEILKNEFKVDYLDQPGVYFLRLNDGYYIGETKNIFSRMSSHIISKEISSITFATYKSELDRLGKEKIRDLESILISYAEESGLLLGRTLKNKKNEQRKTHNILHSRQNEMMATYIWDKMSYLNLKDILDENKSKINSNIAEIEKKKTNNINSLERVVKANIINRNTNSKDIIFNYIPYRFSISQGYMKKNAEIFNKEATKEALFMYLFEKRGCSLIDSKMTNKKRKNGYITAVTLAYLRIETNGEARGVLNNISKNKAKLIIDNFIEENY